MNAVFKSGAAYKGWRRHWRREYAAISQFIRDCKAHSRQPTNNSAEQSQVQSAMMIAKFSARTMMAAREAVEAAKPRKEAIAAAPLPEGYTIMDSDHDNDSDDGRFGLYSPADEFLGNLHDYNTVVALAWEHSRQ